ncbi:MAG: transporter [Betaproteobacteria bacterium]
MYSTQLRGFIHRGLIGLAAALLAGASPAFAAESGKIAVNDGVDDFLLAAMPPPGFYGIVYLSRYTSDYLANNSGNSAVDHFSLAANVAVPRFDWVKPVTIFGADRWGTLVLAPYLDVDAKISPVPGINLADSKRGFGDLTVGNGLHWTIGDYQMTNALDVVAPTGGFDAARVVNLGLNHWTLRLNHLATWMPLPSWEISYGLRWEYNFENPDTHYKSGQIGYAEFQYRRGRKNVGRPYRLPARCAAADARQEFFAWRRNPFGVFLSETSR